MNATVSTRERAWQLADKLFPTDYIKDEHDSLRAGYPVFNTTSTDDKYTGFHISDLNVALELNMGAETIRINIEDQEAEIKNNFDKLLQYVSDKRKSAELHSKIKALSGDTKSIDGFRPYLGIVDEYHAHKDDQMYKLLEGGIKKMKSALISVITTAGFDLKSPCFALYEYCVKVLKGIASNDSQFIYIAQMNESDDMWTPENWIKANPILEYDRDALQNMIPIAATAKEMGGSTLRDFIVKQLNMWIQWTNDVYIKDMDVWTRATVKKTLADFRGQKAYVGLDLSSGGDLTSIAIVIPFMRGEDKCYFVHAHSFIPKRRVEEHIKTDRVPYVEHDGSEATKWSIANAKTTSNSFGEIKIDKEYATERIDIVDAIIDAWMMAMKGEIKPDVNRYLDIWFAGTEKLRQKGGAQG